MCGCACAKGHRPWSDEIFDFSIELVHDRLNAAAGVRTIEGDGLAEWLTELAESFHGWSGTRTWQSLERDLTIHATHERAAHGCRQPPWRRRRCDLSQRQG